MNRFRKLKLNCNGPLIMQSSLFIMAMILNAAALYKEQRSCELFPKDLTVQPGSDVMLVFKAPPNSSCRNQADFSPSKISWELNRMKIADTFYHSDSTIASVTIRNFSLPQATVECLLNDVVLGGTIIRTKVLRRPENISCIVKRDKDPTRPIVSCSWDHDQNTAGSTYTVHIRQHGKNMSCKSSEKKCSFKDEYGPILSKSMNVIVIANEGAEKVISDEKIYDSVFSIVQINPPEDVRVESEWTGLKVTWKNARSTLYFKVDPDSTPDCEVRSKGGSFSESVVKSSDLSSHTLTEVKPCTFYVISVRCKPPKAVWSEWSPSVTALSLLNVSEVQFHVWRTKSVINDIKERTVHLMWQGVPPFCKAFDEYQLSVYTHSSRPVITTCFDPSQNHTIITLDENAHKIFVAAVRNNNSFSNISIEIPRAEEELNLPPVANVSMFAKDGQIHITWDNPNLAVRGCMIIWNTTDDDYMWQTSQETYFSLKGKDATLYAISVIPLYEEGPGSEVKLYSYAREGQLPKMSTVIASGVSDRKAEIHWQPILPSQCCALVVNYTVFYKAWEESEFKNVTVDKNEHLVILHDLKPYTTYSVHVEANSASMSSSSAQTTFPTKLYGELFSTVVIVCGVGVILLPLFTVLVVLMRKKYLSEKFPNPQFSSLSLWSSECGTKSWNQLPLPLDYNSEKILPCQMESEITGLHPSSKTDMTKLKAFPGDQNNVTHGAVEETAWSSSTVKMKPPSSGKEEIMHPLPTLDPQSRDSSPLLLPSSPYRNQSILGSPADAPWIVFLDPRKAHSSGELLKPKIQNSTAVTTYVTVDMFEHGGRGQIKKGGT